MHSTGKLLLRLVLLWVIIVSFGCVPFAEQKHHYSSSVLEYLFPDEQNPQPDQPAPPLEFPLRFAIAFVPETGTVQFSEKLKMDLMLTLSAEIKQHGFVESVELIPTSYLKPKGGFTNLDQISTLYDIDVIMLLCYDQVQHTDEGVASYLYWTWVGAYTVQGEKNDTNTLLDATVLDIASRKKVLHSHGSSHIKGRATLINLSEQLRIDSVDGFKQAGENLLGKIRLELPTFYEKSGHIRPKTMPMGVNRTQATQ